MFEEITKNEFTEKVLSADFPVMVDFFSETCIPCLAMMPIVEEISKRYAGKMLFYKVNIVNNPVLANKYGIISVPAFHFFKNGKSVSKLIGTQPADVLRNTIELLIAANV